jgi:hypothetical protein
MKRFLPSAVALLALTGRADAGPISYFELATATGSLGQTPFTNVLVGIAFGGDTNTVTQPTPGFFQNATGTTVVNVGGMTATFTDAMFAFDSHGANPTAGIGDATLSSIVLGTSDAAFGSYDLNGSIPLTPGASFSFLGISYDTTLGPLVITSVAGETQFGAGVSVSAVPEPATATLFVIGALTMTGYGYQRWRSDRLCGLKDRSTWRGLSRSMQSRVP